MEIPSFFARSSKCWLHKIIQALEALDTENIFAFLLSIDLEMGAPNRNWTIEEDRLASTSSFANKLKWKILIPWRVLQFFFVWLYNHEKVNTSFLEQLTERNDF